MEITDTLVLILVAAISFVATVILTPLVASMTKRWKMVGVDVHKVHRPSLPEMGGIAVLCGTCIVMALLATFVYKSYLDELTAFISAGVIASLVGVRDDLKPLNPKIKPLLTALAGIPILVLGTYSSRPMIPYVGATRLTLIYPILVLVGMAVMANAVNMMDVFNGVMPGSCGIVAASAAIAFIFLGKKVEAAVAIVLVGALSAFYLYNRYPAKVFAGDSGSLFVGGILGSLAIIGRLEIFMIIAMMPFIMNAFYSLSSIGRLYERREVSARPIRILKEGKLDASLNRRAPLTLARLILIHGPLDEKSIVNIMLFLTAVSSGLALATLLWIPGMK